MKELLTTLACFVVVLICAFIEVLWEKGIFRIFWLVFRIWFWLRLTTLLEAVATARCRWRSWAATHLEAAINEEPPKIQP